MTTNYKMIVGEMFPNDEKDIPQSVQCQECNLHKAHLILPKQTGMCFSPFRLNQITIQII